jgi:hypothetical protein
VDRPKRHPLPASVFFGVAALLQLSSLAVALELELVDFPSKLLWGIACLEILLVRDANLSMADESLENAIGYVSLAKSSDHRVSEAMEH